MRRLAGTLILILSALLVSSVLADSNPQPIGYGQSVQGDLSAAAPEALYSFTAQQGDSITATMDLVSGSLDPLLTLVDSTQQTVLATDNDSGGNHNALLRFVIPSSAKYILIATTAQSGGSGTFKLTLSLDNPTPTPSPFTTAPVIAPLDATIQADLTDTTPFRIYTFQAKQGDPINVSLDVTNGIQAGIYLYSSDFSELARAELGATLNAAAPADGLYYLVVARAAAETKAGGFTLHQTQATVLTVQPQQIVHGDITSDNPVRTYSLQNAAGQTLLIRMQRTSGNLVTYVYVVNVDTGAKLAEATDTDGAAELTAVLPASGNFAVIATRDGQQTGTTTGSYSLSIQPPGQSAPMPPTFQGYLPITYGMKVTGEIDDTTYAVPYYFVGRAGDTIQATMLGDNTLNPYLILQNADGHSIAEDDDSAGNMDSRIQFTLPASGYFALVATRAQFQAGKTHGKYMLDLESISAATATPAKTGATLVAGQPQSGTIGPKIASLFNFDAQANTAVNIDVSPASGLDVVTLLVDSNLAQIATSTAGPLHNIILPQARTYTVLVLRRGGPNDPANGTFSITLQSLGQVSVTPSPVLAAITPTPAATRAGAPIIAVTYNGVATGVITAQQFLNYFSFQGTQGDLITIRMTRTPGSALDPLLYLYVYPPDGGQPKLITSNDNADTTGPDAAIAHFALPQTGTYLIVATRAGVAQGQTTGTYTLILTKDE